MGRPTSTSDKNDDGDPRGLPDYEDDVYMCDGMSNEDGVETKEQVIRLYLSNLNTLLKWLIEGQSPSVPMDFHESLSPNDGEADTEVVR